MVATEQKLKDFVSMSPSDYARAQLAELTEEGFACCDACDCASSCDCACCAGVQTFDESLPVNSGAELALIADACQQKFKPANVPARTERYIKLAEEFAAGKLPAMSRAEIGELIQFIEQELPHLKSLSVWQDTWKPLIEQLAQDMIFELQDKLVEKEFLSAKLYYDLGSYSGNASYSSTGNNYLAAIVTAQNVLNDYPYTKLREELMMLILRARYYMAKESVIEKKEERMREAVDEYYAFINEFPESKYLKEAESIHKDASKYVTGESDIYAE